MKLVIDGVAVKVARGVDPTLIAAVIDALKLLSTRPERPGGRRDQAGGLPQGRGLASGDRSRG